MDKKHTCTRGRCKELDSWAAELARKVQDESGVERPLAKADRIERRREKKLRRLQSSADNAPKPQNTARQQLSIDSSSDSPSKRTKQSSATAHRLERLAKVVNERVTTVKEECRAKSTRPKPYSAVPLVSKKRRRQREDGFQPRSSDYGGIGLARESLKISFDDPSWQPKLEQEFAEHIAGFYGKQRTKAMKKQLDGKMLWRRLLADKQKESDVATDRKSSKKSKSKSHATSINGKSLSSMSPDERVEAMIQAGPL
jgi:hypothetical protein